MLKEGSKIVFLEPGSPAKHVFSKVKMPRTGPVLLATMLRERGYDTKVFCQDIDPIDWQEVKQADLVGISTITSTAPAAYQMARKIKQLSDATVIMGGPHVTFLPDEALANGADIVFRRESEDTLLEFIENMKDGRPTKLSSIRGISFKQNGQIVHTPARDYLRTEQLDQLPTPDLSLVKGWERRETLMVYPLALSRGCPHKCSFCSVVRMFGRKYRTPCLEKTMQEIRLTAQRAHSTVFFVDDNLAANKHRTKKFLSGMVAEGIRLNYSAQFRASVAYDLELVKLLRQSGCNRGYFGFESISTQTLQNADKRQSLADIEHCIRVMQDNDIDVHGMFVFFGNEDVRDIYRTAEFAQKSGITTAQFLILTPFPGTPVYEIMKQSGRLLPLGWEHYTTHEPLFQPEKMSADQIFLHTLWAHALFYGPKYIYKHYRDIHKGVRNSKFYTLMGLYAQSTVWPNLLRTLAKKI